jgi:hypothetical protein
MAGAEYPGAVGGRPEPCVTFPRSWWNERGVERTMRCGGVISVVVALLTTAAAPIRQPAPPAGACFLLLDVVSGQLHRGPDAICDAQLPPASTFKIAHAIAALDSGVIRGADELTAYDGWKGSTGVRRLDDRMLSQIS